jgi:hypothetical protein
MCPKYSDENDKKPKRIIRSSKLRKYASVYKSYVRKSEQSHTNKSPRRTRCKCSSSKKKESTQVSKSKRKTLNPYQKFVKDESKKEKYKEMSGKERLIVIAREWKKINKNI